MNKRKYIFLSQKKYKSYALCEREIVFQKKKFGKQLIENKPYFYKSFPLTKDSFPLINFFFLYYQTLENVENYLYKRFSNETNRAFV